MSMEKRILKLEDAIRTSSRFIHWDDTPADRRIQKWIELGGYDISDPKIQAWIAAMRHIFGGATEEDLDKSFLALGIERAIRRVKRRAM